MKLPLSYHPLFVLLFSLVFAAISFALGFVSSLPRPFGNPFSFWGIGVGFGLGLLKTGIEALVEKSGGDAFLVRRLSRREVYWSGPYWWLRLVWWGLALPLVQSFGVFWEFSGLCLGVAAAYPYWRGHWQRLQRVAEEEQARLEAVRMTTG